MSTAPQPLLIVGASARAAAFSAARAGYAPYWIDRFGDVDLDGAFPGVCLGKAYPDAVPEAAAGLPAMPFLYTGAMENHRTVLEALAGERELLGNDARVCGDMRDPFRLQQCLQAAGLASAAVSREPPRDPVADGWLCKSHGSSGGLGIRFHEPPAPVPDGHYLQEFIEGRSVSAVFIGDGSRAHLAGVTRQLVGKAAFHAARFAYCGSIGPLRLSAAEAGQWHRIGSALVGTFGLRGLFGVDAVERRDSIIPVEVNPRYTASVEVIEAGTGLPLLDCHVSACRQQLLRIPERNSTGLYGKSYLFAPERLHVHRDLRIAPMPCQLDAVALADVPAVGTVIEAGAPVLSLHVAGRDQLDCLQLLTGKAAAILETLVE